MQIAKIKKKSPIRLTQTIDLRSSNSKYSQNGQLFPQFHWEQYQ